MSSTFLFSIRPLLGRIAATGAVMAALLGGVGAHAQQAPIVFSGQVLKTQPIQEGDLRPLLDELHDAESSKLRALRLQSREFPQKLASARAAVRKFGQSLKANHEEEAFRQYAMGLARSNGQTELLARLERPGSVAALLADADRDLMAAARDRRPTELLGNFFWQLAGVSTAQAATGPGYCPIGCLFLPTTWCAEHCGY
jgi:hypothetical protein